MEEHFIQRKNIRLKEYDYSRPGYYFVTVCTHERQRLFSNWVGAHPCVRPPVNGNFIVDRLYDMEQKYPNVRMDEWCIMPDHIHMILIITGDSDPPGAHMGAPLRCGMIPLSKPGTVGLSEMIKWYKTQTTNEYIRQVRAGILPPFQKHVWQRGYYEHVIRNDEDLAETRRYIQNNPLKLTLKDSEDKE